MASIDISETVNAYVNSLKFTVKSSSKVINIDTFRTRSTEIDNIGAAIDALMSAVENLKEIQAKMIEAHDIEVAAITGLLSDDGKASLPSNKKKQVNNGWSIVQKGGKTKQIEKSIPATLPENRPVQTDYRLVQAESRTTTSEHRLAQTEHRAEKITRYIEGLKIEAVNLHHSSANLSGTAQHLSRSMDSFANQMQPGVLYYNEANDCYLIKIAGMVLSGNVGIIYNHEKNPELIKRCKWGTTEACQYSGKCGYYHTDVKHRNFMVPMWMYNSYSNNVNNGYRGFGSRDKLSQDISYVKEEDIDRHSAMLFHDLLCLCLMKQNIRS